MRNALRSLSFAVVMVTLVESAPAFAHIALEWPPPRTSDQKAGPCGVTGSARGQTYTAFPPGAVITVRWRETIDHPGHFRISFDDDGDDDFVDPASFEDRDTAPSVLVDGIADAFLGAYEQQVTLPDITCERCTLQVIQVMTDKPPYGDGNDLYYQCADLALRDDADPEGEQLRSSPDGGEEPVGCAHVRPSRGFGGGGALALVVVTLLAARRRPR